MKSKIHYRNGRKESVAICNSYHNGYSQGLCDGQQIMADVITIALNDEFGFGNTDKSKWDKLQDRANEYLKNIIKYINENEPEMGFEHIVEGIKRARPEIADIIEERYKKVLYNFKM